MKLSSSQLTEEQGARLCALIESALTPEVLAPIAAEINAACAENEAAWRKEHDEHAAEPIPPTEPVAVTGEQLAMAARAWAADEVTAIALGAAVVTKRIAPWAVPYFQQNAFEKKRSLIILDMLFRLPITQRFRDFYAGNVVVQTHREEDTGMAVVDVAMRDALHVPDLPKPQETALKHEMHRAGIGKIGYWYAKFMKVLQPMSQPPKEERRLHSVPKPPLQFTVAEDGTLRGADGSKRILVEDGSVDQSTNERIIVEGMDISALNRLADSAALQP